MKLYIYKTIFTGMMVVLFNRSIMAAEKPEIYKGSSVSIYGETKYKPGFKHFDYVNPDAPKGGTLRLAASGTFDSFNPFIMRGRKPPSWNMTYDTLFTASADEPYANYGVIAESIEFPKDRSWVVFNLHQKARWHDGNPITADDVVYTFNMRMKKGAPGFKFYYSYVDSVEALGPKKVRFNIKSGEANHEIPLILGQMEVMPKHYWEKHDFSVTTLEPPLTSGPYKIKRFDQGRYIEYERVKDYWAKDLPVNVGKYNFDLIRYTFYRDDTVRLEAFKTGDYDWRTEYTAKNWAKGYECSALDNGLIIKELLPNKRPGAIYGWVFNSRRKIFTDRNVRKALGYAFDFEWTNKKLFYSAYTRLRSYFENTDLEAKGLPQGKELEILNNLKEKYPGHVWPEIFTEEFNPPSTPEWVDSKKHKRDVRKNLLIARDILKKAGWYIRKDDMKLINDDYVDVEGNHVPFEFTVLLVNPVFEAITLPMVRILEKLGITVTVRTVESAQYSNRVKDFDFDCIVNVWGISLSPGNEQAGMWGAEAADTPGSSNYAGVKSPAVDEVLDYIVKCKTREELQAYSKALDRLLQWGYYLIPAWGGGDDRVAYWDKLEHPYPAEVPIWGMGNVLTWWINPEKAKTLDARIKEMGKTVNNE